MTNHFRETYQEKSDDELLRLAAKRNSLPNRAKYDFDAEMWSRGFVQSDLADVEAQQPDKFKRAAKAAGVHAEKTNWLSHLRRVLGIFFVRH